MIKLLINYAVEMMFNWINLDRWTFFGFSGAGISGWGAFFLEHGSKVVAIVGGVVMVVVSVWQKLQDNKRKQAAFEADEKRKSEKFDQELRQDEEEFQQTKRNK